MNGGRAIAALALVLSATACATAPAPSAAPPPEAQFAHYVATVDEAARRALREARTPEERSLVQAELAFAADAHTRGNKAAFAAAAHPQSRLFVPGGNPIAVGPDAAGALYESDGSDLRWAPVEWAVSGDLGVTWGVYALLTKDARGAPLAVRGRFLTVWRKDAGGAWKWWLDIGNTGPGLSPEALDAARAPR